MSPTRCSGDVFFGSWDRVSIVAFTHQAIFSIAARPHIDSLRRYGFKPPEDASACKAFATTTARDLCKQTQTKAKTIKTSVY